MKTKHFYLVPVLLFTLLFTQSCKDDDENIVTAPKEITFGDKTISLENANISTWKNDTTSDWKYREYTISDGTYKDSGSRYNLSNYDNATYILNIELAVKLGESSEVLTTGEYPQWSNWSSAANSDDTMISYVYVETLDGEEYDTLRESDGGDHPPIVVSGGLNNGEKMILSANGTMEYEDADGNESPVNFSLNFEGIVIDKIN